MKFTVDVNILKAALKKLSLAIMPGANNPIIRNLLVVVTKERAVFIATDLNITIKYELECKLDGDDAQLLIPFAELKQLVAFEEGLITIEQSRNKIYLRGATDEFCLGNPGKPEDFPTVPKVAAGNLFDAPEGLINAMIMAAAGVSKDELKQAMMCVLVELQKTGVNVVSTDTHSLYLNGLPCELAIEDREDLLVPGSAAKAMEGFTAAKIGFNTRHAAFVSGPITVFTRRGDNKFPAYRAVVPAHDGNVTIKVEDLKNALNKALVVTAEISNSPVDLYFSKEQVELKTEQNESGMSAKCAMQADAANCTTERFRVNGRILKRTLAQLQGHASDNAEVNLCVRDANKAMTIRLIGRDDLTLLAMPIIIN